MYLHHYKKIGFIAHPRTASTATAHTLMQMGFEITSLGHHGMANSMDNDWKFFCTVRNPFDVMVSWYYAQKREHSFGMWLPIFLRECHFFQDTRMFYGQTMGTRGSRMFFGQENCTRVMHFETLQDDFDGLCNDFGFHPRTIERRNVSVRRVFENYMSRYNFKRARMVSNRFRDDFIENGYNHCPALKDD